MNNLRDLVSWAQNAGVELNGITPQEIPSKGVGVVASRQVKAGEVVLNVPTAVLRTLDTVPANIRQKLPATTSLHGLLAAQLALNGTPECAAWGACLPPLESFQSSLPLLWPAEIQALLPSRITEIVAKQQNSFKRDWDIFRPAFHEVDRDQYLHAWLLINSRTFYNLTSSTEKLPHDDRLTLMPLADLFNHAGHGCNVTFSNLHYAFTADRDYDAGEELYISYGDHSNDFLLAEYGFMLENNCWDEVSLDDIIFPRLSTEQMSYLSERDCLNNYMLLSSTATGCPRTQTALEAMLGDQHDGGRSGTTASQDANGLLKELAEGLAGQAAENLNSLKKLSPDQHELPRNLLTQRWMQIHKVAKETQDRLS
jgi:hypothetical protein